VVDAVGRLIVLGFVGLLVGLFVVLSLFLLGIIFAFSLLLVIVCRLGGRLLALRGGCYRGK
jgi:energy-coupling factor transporter transmembrane protein EcfT